MIDLADKLKKVTYLHITLNATSDDDVTNSKKV